jgi:hypothetical protein
MFGEDRALRQFLRDSTDFLGAKLSTLYEHLGTTEYMYERKVTILALGMDNKVLTGLAVTARF